MTATLPLSRPMSFSSFRAMLILVYPGLADATQAMLAAFDRVFCAMLGLILDSLIG
jgi:hypothetical protein